MPRPRAPCPTNMLDRLMLDLGKGILEFDKIYWYRNRESSKRNLYILFYIAQPRSQGTFRNESTLVDRGHVVSPYCLDFGQQNNVFERGAGKAI